MKVIRYDIDPIFNGYDIVPGESYLCNEKILNDFNPKNINIPFIESDNFKLKSKRNLKFIEESHLDICIKNANSCSILLPTLILK